MSLSLDSFQKGFYQAYSYGNHALHDGVDAIGMTVKKVKGIQSFCKMSQYMIDFSVFVYGKTAFPALQAINVPLKCFKNLSSALKIVDHTKDWICPEDQYNPEKIYPFWLNKATPWIAVIKKFFSTLSSCCTTIKYLDATELFDAGTFAASYATIPFIGFIFRTPLKGIKDTSSLISALLGLWDDRQKISQFNKASELHGNKLRKWSCRQAKLSRMMDDKDPDSAKNRNDLHEFYESKIQAAKLEASRIVLRSKLPLSGKPEIKKSAELVSFEQRVNDLEARAEWIKKRIDSLQQERKNIHDKKQAVMEWQGKIAIFLNLLEEFEASTKDSQDTLKKSELKKMKELACNYIQILENSIEMVDYFIKEKLITTTHTKQFCKKNLQPRKSATQSERAESELAKLATKIEWWSNIASGIKENDQGVIKSIQERYNQKIESWQYESSKNFLFRTRHYLSSVYRVGKICVASLGLGMLIFGASGLICVGGYLFLSLITYSIGYYKFLWISKHFVDQSFPDILFEVSKNDYQLALEKAWNVTPAMPIVEKQALPLKNPSKKYQTKKPIEKHHFQETRAKDVDFPKTVDRFSVTKFSHKGSDISKDAWLGDSVNKSLYETPFDLPRFIV